MPGTPPADRSKSTCMEVIMRLTTWMIVLTGLIGTAGATAPYRRDDSERDRDPPR